MRRVLVIAAAMALALPAAAHARVVAAVSILPPGQSGFVSLTGLTTGNGSPHLYDQQQPFIDFQRKNAMLGEAGDVTTPISGVRIVRDAYGVPSVTGDNAYALWWGAGYAIAQDRLFELELFRRATQGHLAEILGKSYLPMDIANRRDYYTPRELDAMFARLPAAFQERYRAYADGVNAWIAHVRLSPLDLPGEFPAEGDALPTWTARDSIAISIYLARTVPSGDGAELDNLLALRRSGPRVLNALLPLHSVRPVLTVPRANGAFPSQPGRTRRDERIAFARSQRFVRDLPLPSASADGTLAVRRAQAALGGIGRPGGSYMFAVRRRSDGHAILFNGPQLGFSAPELFVELELHGPGLDVRGATAPGVPVIGIGHNEDVAWGFTSGLTDDNDLYAEKLVAGHPDEYWFRGRIRRMDCRTEAFSYNSPPTDLLSRKLPQSGRQTVRICRTVHGPVQARAGGIAYARRYAIWGRELESLQGIADLNAARDINDVNRAMLEVTWNENVIAADSKGNIGYWHPGLHPLRPLRWDERLPYPGTGEAEWRGLLPRSRDPHVINPAQGWLANWNNFPSSGWTSGDGPAKERLAGPFHRAAYLFALVRRLAAAPTFTGAEDVIAHTGTISQQRPLDDARLRRALRGADGRAAVVLSTILGWDGSYARTAADGTVDPGVATWQAFEAELTRIAMAPLGPGAAVVQGGPGGSHHFDVGDGTGYALRVEGPAGYRAAAAAAFDKLRARFGSADPARWRARRDYYKITIQGAGHPPALPFFDRGTFEQFVELAP
jgi:penicillin amidase